jgi:hydrogenase nickel incorporation protein HypA/HybF
VLSRCHRLHELSLAQSIVEATLEESRRQNSSRIMEMTVEVGELMQLDLRALRFSLKVLSDSPELKGVKFRTRLVHASFLCRKCGCRWSMKEAKEQLENISHSLLVKEPEGREVPLHFLPQLYPAFLRCPKCGSSNIDVTKGKDLRLTKSS